MTATVKGGFFPENGINTLSEAQTRTALKKRAAFALSRRGLLPLQELGLTLDGIVAGSTALKQLSRIEHNVELGGKRTIETIDLINRASVAGDVTEINEDIFAYNSYDATPVANGDGNPLGTR